MTAEERIEPEDVLSPRDVLDFWFAAGADKWFVRDAEFDAEIAARFRHHHEAAKSGVYDDWQNTAEGALALIILLDQFARNIYRGTPQAFDADAHALEIARAAVDRGLDMELPAAVRQWFYLPFEHSENMADQERALFLFERSGLDEGLKWAKIHADIIRRFGRFPHRNPILGRDMTEEEQRFLDEGGFAG